MLQIDAGASAFPQNMKLVLRTDVAFQELVLERGADGEAPGGQDTGPLLHGLDQHALKPEEGLRPASVIGMESYRAIREKASYRAENPGLGSVRMKNIRTKPAEKPSELHDREEISMGHDGALHVQRDRLATRIARKLQKFGSG